MKMSILRLFLLFTCYKTHSSALKTYDDRPHITTYNGHLTMVASPGKNINFKTVGESIVSINKVNVLDALTKAVAATKLTESYRHILTSYSDRIEALESRPLEPFVNTSIVTNGTDSAVSRLLLRRINRRIDVIQRKVNSLLGLLSIDDCTSDPCKNGGTCQDMFGNYLCHCLPGWEGVDCSKDVNECVILQGTDLGCQNGGICVNTVGSYRCDCVNGYMGLHCLRKSIDCASGGPELCGHGTCITQNNEKGYKCLCDPGWTTSDGKSGPCTVDVNECLLNHPPCAPNVDCINIPGSFVCGHCPTGFTGNGYHCNDINECSINNGGCSTNPTVMCINTHGSRVCGPCPVGYVGDGVTCTYQGVCKINNGGCHPQATCSDGYTLGAIQCVCPSGYIGTGIGPNGCVRSNVPLNPCSPNPCVNGRCSVNTVDGNYQCFCYRYYNGKNCDTLRSDACTPNPCQNDGECLNVNNRLRCKCKSAFTGVYCQTQLQGCGGYLRGDNGTLKFPTGDFESYNHRSNCAWNILLNSTSKVIKVNISRFDIEESPECKNDWLEIHDGQSTNARLLGRFCGNKIPLNGTFTTTQDSLYLWFRSNGDVAKGGFQLNWTAVDPVCDTFIHSQIPHGSIQSPGSPGNYPLNRDCHWKMYAPYNKRFMFHFFSLDIGDNKDCSADYIKLYPTLFPRDRNSTFATFCNSSNPAPFYSPGNLVYMHFHSDDKEAHSGFQLTYSVVEGKPGCGGVFTATQGIIRSAHLDSGDFSVCQYTIQQSTDHKIRITFAIFDLDVTGGCTINYVEIHEGLDEHSPLVGRYCGNNLPAPYISQSNQLTIISSSSTSQNNKGWKLEYTSVCGKIYTASSGSFDVISNSRDSDCIYQIQRPPGNLIILFMKVNMLRLATHRLQYIRFTRDDEQSCFSKYIEVRDGDNENSTLIGKYCGVRNVNITSSHNFLWMRVQYSTRYGNNQISISYTSMDVGCGGILRNKFGNIASPTHPDGYYPPSLSCKWAIIAPPSNVIQLTWMTFNLEPSHECAYDNVVIYDNNTGLSGEGSLMGKYCGFSLPPRLLTSSNIMTIIFTTDVTVSMDGFLASYIFIPENNVCGGNYFTTSGVIKSPRYPDPYPTNRECTWTINVPPGQQIFLNITDFNIEYYSGCRYDWLEIRNGGTSASPLIGKFCGSSAPKQITSHANRLYVFFKSDLSRTGHGFRLTWMSTATGCGGVLTSPTGSLISPHYPEPYSRNTECLWKIFTSAGSRVQVVFSDINLEKNMQCLADYVQLFDGLTTNTPSLGKFCFEAPKPVKSTSNVMLVKFRSDVAFQGRGFQLHYTTVCQNVIKGFSGIIESPNFPNEYPQDQNCLWEIIVSDRNKINITFSHFDMGRSMPSLNNSNTSCSFDYIEISYADYPQPYEEKRDYIKQGRYCGSQSPGHLTLPSDNVRLRFVSDKLLQGSGFRLEWNIFGCGGILTKNSGSISSPNYPNAYPVSVVCEWRIEVDFWKSIELKFVEIDVESGSTCEFDSVSVYNGLDDTYPLLAKICRQKNSTVISSTGNYMFVKFQSDYSYHGKGFLANYNTVPTKCGGQFTSEAGYIYSPNYPKNYDKNETCEYYIVVGEGHTIEITFEDVDLYKSDNCSMNYVKVHDGPSPAYPVLITACGTETPNNTIKSSYNNIFIEFRSHAFYTTKGFKLKYQTSCGSRIVTQGNGILEIANSEFSDDMLSCTWTIVSSDSTKHVYLLVSQLQTQYYCDTEYAPFQVFNGESIESPLIGKYCGPKVPPTITSDGSAITIYLSSALTFSATYSVFDSQCGGTLKSAEGYFASPGYPRKYASDAQCEWEIKIAEGNHVAVNFIEFDLLQSENCNTDFLEIRSYNSSGPLLGVYCGQNKPKNLSHVGTLWIFFKSSKIEPGDTSVKSIGFYAEYILQKSNELTGPYGQIWSPLYPLPIMDYDSYSWKITVTTKKLIRLSFIEFYLDANDGNDDECYFASLEIYDGVDDTASSLGKYCGLSLPKPVTSTSNIMFIKIDYSSPRLGSKFKIKWEEIQGPNLHSSATTHKTDCNTTDDVINLNGVGNYVLTSPGYPNGYAHNFKCTWIFNTISMNHLIVQFTDIDLAGSRNRLYGVHRACDVFNDNINIYQKQYDDNEWKKVQTVCKMEDVKGIIHVTNLMKVEFVTNWIINGTGFKAKIYETCGGTLRDSTGYIIYNNYTARNSECQWNITVGSTKTIELTFEEMNIEQNSNNGCDDFLMIRNGKFSDSPLLGAGKYCGTTLPEKLRSTSNNMYVKYKGWVSIKGFRLKYQEVSAVCGENIILSSYDNFTEITSPNYPNIPNPHVECMWRITAPIGEVLRIDFEDRFDLTIKQSCDIEYVELRDGATEHSTLIGRYCRSPPSSQFSTSNNMFIKFFTDTDEPKNGFKAKISVSRCGGTIRGRTGDLNYVSSPHSGKRNCTWHIIGPIDHYVTVIINKLDTTCGNDGSYIDVRQSTDFVSNNIPGETSIGKFCGNIIPKPIKAISNEVKIVFGPSNSGKFALKFNSSQTACGGVLETESGVIQSPGYPIMNHLNRNCNWKIIVPQGRRVTLNLTDVDLGGSLMKYDRGLIIIDGVGGDVRLALIVSGTNLSTIESTSNKMLLFFWSLHRSTHRGFRVSYTSNLPSLCEGDFDKDSGMIKNPVTRNSIYNCEWIHRRSYTAQPMTFAISVTMTTNLTKSTTTDPNCKYFPRVQIKGNTKLNELGTICYTTLTPVTIRSPFLITKLEASSRISYNWNFTATYNTYNCGGLINGESGVISSPDYPNKPARSYECAWLVSVGKGQTINVTFVSINLGDDCEKDFLIIYNGDLPSRPKIGKYCKSSKPELLISQSNQLWIEYKHDQTSNGVGFTLKYEAISSGCGGIFHDKTRIIRTPKYGNADYPNNAECLWIIESEPGFHIKLNFIERFHLEESAACDKDFVQVWGWNEDRWISIGKYCGRNAPRAIESTGERMKILFRSNDVISGAGFKAKWEWLCGGRYLADQYPHYIVSPGYPVSYSPNLKCEYIIDTKSTAINIQFLDFHLEAEDLSCKYDNVTISTKGNMNIYSKNTFCGDKNPGSFRLKGIISIVFETDSWLNKKGFMLEYKDDSCGGNITEETILSKESPLIISSSNTMYYHQPKIRCVWNITAPTNQVIVLLIKKLDLFSSVMCYGQNLEVFSNLNMNKGSRLAELCGNLVNEYPIPSETGHMVVKLETMPSSFRGFLAAVRFTHGPAEGCGGKINLTDTKAIQSPNLGDLDCAWSIIAPRDYQIDIKINSFISIGTSCGGVNTTNITCGCNVLEIRDGVSPFSDKIETFCNNIADADIRPIRTSTNNGYIRFMMKGQTNNAFKATLTPVLSSCGITELVAKKEKKTLTSPNYDSGSYSSFTKCSYAISASTMFERLALHFDEFDLTDEISITDDGQECTGDYIQIFEDPNLSISGGLGSNVVYNGVNKRINMVYADAKGRHMFCGKNGTPFDYYTTGQSVTISLVSKGTTPKGKGFKLEYSIAGCNRNYTGLNGRVYNGNDRSSCQFSIIVPENRTISVYFNTFWMLFTANCSDSAMEVRDGSPTGNLLVKVCGYRLPDPIFSATNKLFFNVRSRQQPAFSNRFDMIYTSSKDGPGCGGEIFNNKGKVFSPMYPNPFRNNTICTWTVRPPIGLHLALKFTILDIQGSCEQTNIRVDLGSSTVEICQNYQLNGPILRSRSTMTITYTSSIHNGGTGWIASFQAVSSDITDVI